jgi:HEPN domain-containing protein
MMKSELFKADEDWWHNACLNFTRNDWDLYAVGYKKAADMLIEQIVADNNSSRASLDTIIYPIVFLYRQYLELRLKQLIIEYHKLDDRNVDLPKTHKLDMLWSTARNLIEEIDTENASNSADMFHEVELLIEQFSAIDPSSTGFRYPVDKNNNLSLPGLHHINVRHLYTIVENTSSILEDTRMHVSVCLDDKSEYEAAMQVLYGDNNYPDER